MVMNGVHGATGVTMIPRSKTTHLHQKTEEKGGRGDGQKEKEKKKNKGRSKVAYRV